MLGSPCWLAPIALQHLDVIGSLEGCRIRDIALTQASTKKIEVLKLARGKPALEAIKQNFHVGGSMPQQRRAGHHDVGAGQQILYDFVGAFDPGASGKRSADPP